jgi:hypothetical protein
MSGLQNTDLLQFPYLHAVVILVLLVLVYQVYYVLLPKLSQVAKVCGVEGIGPSHLSVLSDMGPAGTVGLYVPDGNVKSGFFGGSESPVFYPEGDENAYRQYRSGDSDASYKYWACPPGVVLNADGSCPGGLVEMTGGTSAQIAAQQATNLAAVKINRNYKNADGDWVSCGKNMKVNLTGDGCTEGFGGPSRDTLKSEGMSGGDRIAAAAAQMY